MVTEKLNGKEREREREEISVVLINKATKRERTSLDIRVSRLSQVNDIIRRSSGRVQTRFLFFSYRNQPRKKGGTKAVEKEMEQPP